MGESQILSELDRHAEALKYVNGMPGLDKDVTLLMEKAMVLENLGRIGDAAPLVMLEKIGKAHRCLGRANNGLVCTTARTNFGI